MIYASLALRMDAVIVSDRHAGVTYLLRVAESNYASAMDALAALRGGGAAVRCGGTPHIHIGSDDNMSHGRGAALGLRG